LADEPVRIIEGEAAPVSVAGQGEKRQQTSELPEAVGALQQRDIQAIDPTA
jgi:hypothetical protein